tara:strand:+ start:3228 stop:4301 length:1074 start_codon:yes stop_codon:yes gene_type:complete
MSENPSAGFASRVQLDFAGDPSIVPHSLDLISKRVLLLDIPDETRLGASFLDDRVVTAAMPACQVTLDDFLTRAVTLPPPTARLGFIFHIGHCGSTLISRLLASDPQCDSHREPQILRHFADAALDAATPWAATDEAGLDRIALALTRCWARPGGAARHVIVKATSLTNGVAPRLMTASPASPALALRMRLEPYLAALLAPNPPSADLMLGARNRLARLQARCGALEWRLHSMSAGELAAASWLCEANSVAALAQAWPGRVLGVDFDHFLAAPQTGLLQIAAHFGLGWDEHMADQALNSDIMRRYSKAPEHDFDPGFRQRVLDDSRRRNADEIGRGLRFARQALADFPVLQAVAVWM